MFTAFVADAPYMIHNLLNWDETYYEKYKNIILKELVKLVTDDSDEDESAFRAAGKIFNRIMKRNIHSKQSAS